MTAGPVAYIADREEASGVLQETPLVEAVASRKAYPVVLPVGLAGMVAACRAPSVVPEAFPA